MPRKNASPAAKKARAKMLEKLYGDKDNDYETTRPRRVAYLDNGRSTATLAMLAAALNRTHD